MLKPGLVSVTFRQLAPREIVNLAAQAKLQGIEWGGDVHVPHGDLARAAEVRQMTVDAGLAVSSYGSYYKVGVSETQGLGFGAVLDSALTLQVPTIRVWAGGCGSADATAEDWAHVVAETQRIAGLAAPAGVEIAFEFHSGTLADTPATALRLQQAVGRPNVRTYWQPIVNVRTEENLAGLQSLADRVANVHVFHWLRPAKDWDRRPLAEGSAPWARYLAALPDTRAHWALLEFVRDDAPAQLMEDAATLTSWLEGIY